MAEAGHRLLPNAERHLRPREVLAELYPAALLEETLRDRGALRVLTRAACGTAIRMKSFRQDITASEHLRSLAEVGASRRWPRGRAGTVQATIQKELALIGQLQLRAFLFDRA